MEPGKLGPIRGRAAVATCRPFSGRGVTKGERRKKGKDGKKEKGKKKEKKENWLGFFGCGSGFFIFYF